jgi:exosome complex RNA-binding protein Csl4
MVSEMEIVCPGDVLATTVRLLAFSRFKVAISGARGRSTLLSYLLQGLCMQAQAQSGLGTYVDGDSVLASICGVVHRVTGTEPEVRIQI